MGQWVYSRKVQEALGNAGTFADRGTLQKRIGLQTSSFGEILPVHLLLGLLSVESDLIAAFDAVLASGEITSGKRLIDELESFYGVNKGNTLDIIEGDVVHQERLAGYARPLMMDEKDEDNWFTMK